jgi:hypothetical protein
MATVFLGCPTHDGRLHAGAARGIYYTPSKLHSVSPWIVQDSLLPTSCNNLLVSAISSSADWLAILHSDVDPEPNWIDALIHIAESHLADFVSAVVPIKDDRGVTSTAIAGTSNTGCFARLTQSQVRHPSFPDTFGIMEAAEALCQLPNELRVVNCPRIFLLANTGCMIYRIAHWRPGVKFSNEDDIAVVGGRVEAVWQSEDWFFSRSIAERGGKVLATKSLRVRHWGTMAFDSHSIWGQPRDH